MENTLMKMEQFYMEEVIIPQGQDIKKGLTNYILANGWKQVYVSGAVGSVIDMAFTAPIQNHLPLKVSSTPVSGAGEMLSMTGEIMPREMMDPDLKDVYTDKDSPLFVHIHASFATSGGHVFGGGLKSGKAFRSLRIFMVPLE
ncbi:MAG: DNA-binding protein [Acidaminococcaceae bacterium]|jgi:predicted DNA-binding protein with PD1-like motif|nr:DNA-binding protein [Acidaminococcaceae bacterium]MCI2110107.1 DNA-binding protein [Acidaminococcaceae bacterium]